MNFQEVIETFARQQVRKHRLASYMNSDRRPWRRGYAEYRNKYLTHVITNNAILEMFREGNPLPDGYGFRLDARVVEIPWVLARLAQKKGRLLDAGSSLNHKFVLEVPALTDKKITIITLAPEAQCYWMLGISYIFGDLRNLDFRDNLFDLVVCISTIEHVGMDNTRYHEVIGSAEPQGHNEFLLAIREIRRIIKPGGVLFITFPFGQYENHIWFQQFDSLLMDKLIEAFSPIHCNEAVFRYDSDGWRRSDRDSCSNCRFFDVHKSKYFDPNSTIDYPSDYPAGEGAIACLELVK